MDRIDDPTKSADSRTPTQTGRTRSWWLPVLAAVVIAGLLAAHVPGVNGPSYFPWPWQRLAAGRTGVVALLVAAQILIIAWATRPRVRHWAAIIALVAGAGLLRVGTSMAPSDPPGLTYARQVTRDPQIGSFFSFAQGLRGAEWSLESYPDLLLLPQLPLHVVNKPPGPTLFWLALLGDDPDRAATLGITIIALLSAAAVGMMAVTATSLGCSDTVARNAAALLSLAPGAIVFFPLFDPALTTMTLALAALWFTAVRRESTRWSVAFGVALAASLFVAFHTLAIGAFLAAAGIVIARRWMAFVRAAAIALVSCVVGCVVMQLVTGYDVLATFHSALARQHELMARFGAQYRQYPQTVPWDLYDYALGVGVVPVLLAAILLVRPEGERRLATVGWCGVGVLVLIAGAGFMPGETSRVWNFLFPLILLPAAGAVGGLSRRGALLTYGAMGIVLVAIVQNLRFMAVDAIVH